MADQDTSKHTPAPYKGSQGRLQALNQQLAGASTAGGGGGLGSKLRPLMEGISASTKASQQASEVASQISMLRREQQSDSTALRGETIAAEREIRESTSTLDTINLAVTGAMTLEALSDRIADGMQATEMKTKRVKVGTRDKTDPETGNISQEDVFEDVEYESTVDTKMGGIMRFPSKALQKIIPSVGHMRSGQREDELAREDERADMMEYQAVSTFRHHQEMEFKASYRDALKQYSDDMLLATGGMKEALASLHEKILSQIGKTPQNVLKDYFEMTAPKERDIVDPSGPKAPDAIMWDPMKKDALLAPVKRSMFRRGQGIDRPHPLGEELMMGQSELEPLKRVMFSGESNNSFSAMNQGGNKSTGIIGSAIKSEDVIGVDVKDLTIDEIRERGKLPMRHEDRIFAVGRGQWVVPAGKGAFEEAVKAAGLKGTDKFSEANQRRMEDEYIMSLPVVKKYQRGEATVQEVQSKLAQIWKALKDVTTGAGTADSDGLNKATVDSTDVIVHIENIIGSMGRKELR